ncbi:DNA-binding transcriptional LysR family regulator [Actinomadura rupiterrae]|nr:DNA-binding transcriptional LysR family regulator [Actinomadura rupiterrae]
MELRQLRYFVAVAEEGGFTRAAERLHVAQPGISAQVRQLEREFGQELFDRSGRSVKLTEAGEAVLPYARAALWAADGARLAVDELTGLIRGRVAVGTVTSMPSALVPDLLAGLHCDHPGVEITLSEGNSADLLRDFWRDGSTWRSSASRVTRRTVSPSRPTSRSGSWWPSRRPTSWPDAAV